MKVLWSDTATQHLLAIHEFISLDSKQYALQVIDRLTRRTQQLESFPESGRAVPEIEDQQIREIIEHPYRIIYRVGEARIDVLAIVHGARLLPQEEIG